MQNSDAYFLEKSGDEAPIGISSFFTVKTSKNVEDLLETRKNT